MTSRDGGKEHTSMTDAGPGATGPGDEDTSRNRLPRAVALALIAAGPPHYSDWESDAVTVVTPPADCD